MHPLPVPMSRMEGVDEDGWGVDGPDEEGVDEDGPDEDGLGKGGPAGGLA